MNEFLTVENLRIASWAALVASVIASYYSAHHLRNANGESEFVQMVLVVAIGLVVVNAMGTYISYHNLRVAPGVAGACVFGLRLVPLALSCYLANRIWKVMKS